MNVSIHEIEESDLSEADRIFRLAFATFLHIPDPMHAFGDKELVRTRWKSPHVKGFAAEVDGVLVGSNFVTHWGGFGFFGPLTVDPKFWDKGIAKKLLEPTMETFSKWKVSHASLFTFAQSAKHIGLYEKVGFHPRFLTALLRKDLQRDGEQTPSEKIDSFSRLGTKDREECLSQCRNLANSAYKGLDLTQEVLSVEEQKLGDTVLVYDGSELVGYAVCHYGAGTEGGSGNCYVKFGMVRGNSRDYFDHLLISIEGLCRTRGISSIEAGMNLAREQTYGRMKEKGYRAEFLGVCMDKPNEAGYNRPEVFIIDDLR